MKLAFFFSYSACFSSGEGAFCDRDRQSTTTNLADGTKYKRTSWIFWRVPLDRALLGDPSSLTSLKLERRPSERPLECLLLWGNLIPRRDLPVMAKTEMF